MTFELDVLRAGNFRGMRVSREGRGLTVERWRRGAGARGEKVVAAAGAVVSVQGRP